MDPPAADPQRAADGNNSAVWGPVATLFWTVVIALVFVIVQSLTGAIYVVATMGDLSHDVLRAALHDLKFDGTFRSFDTLAALLVCVPLIAGIVKLKRGSKVKDYLGLTVPRLRQFLQWSLAASVFCGLAGLIISLRNRETASHFFLEEYESANPRWLLWLAVAIAAPILEEIFFRGFLFTGLAASRLRWYGATLVTAALWAAIHSQYDWYQVSVIFAFGLVLGAVRAMTNSTLLTIWLHSLNNVLAIVETAIALEQIYEN